MTIKEVINLREKQTILSGQSYLQMQFIEVIKFQENACIM